MQAGGEQHQAEHEIQQNLGQWRGIQQAADPAGQIRCDERIDDPDQTGNAERAEQQRDGARHAEKTMINRRNKCCEPQKSRYQYFVREAMFSMITK